MEIVCSKNNKRRNNKKQAKNNNNKITIKQARASHKIIQLVFKVHIRNSS